MPETDNENDSDKSNDGSDIDIGPSSPISAPIQKSARPAHENLETEATTSIHPVSNLASSIESTQASRSSPSRVPTTTDTSGELTGSTLRGTARFRATARKVMRMRSSMLGALSGVGAEPGIDPRNPVAIATYGHLLEKCTIEVVDYSSLRSKVCSFNNKSFLDFLKTNGTAREPWAKVRWICIGGISWDVISALALQYELHPLSLEDVFRSGHVSSKADYFAKHLFLRVACHTLTQSDAVDHTPAYDEPRPITTFPHSFSTIGLNDEKDATAHKEGDNKGNLRQRSPGFFGFMKQGIAAHKSIRGDLESGPRRGFVVGRSNTRLEFQATVNKLKAGERIDVSLTNLFMFLMRDGTLVSIHQTPTSDFAAPILSRLRPRDTVLRKTADASLLLQSILDLVVDQAMQVMEEYHKRILQLEHQILLKPKMRSVQSLHILSGDLTSHKRTLEPLKTLVYGLRRYDLDRCIAVAASAAGESPEGDETPKVVGYMSHKSKVYLADVHDHIEYILSSLDMFASISENLINYTFNMASYEMNEVMRRLTLATIIFLPLTLLTGYFGMNFDPMWSVNANSDVLFWKIAIPVMVVIIPLFLWNDIIRAKHFAEKKMTVKRVSRMIARA